MLEQIFITLQRGQSNSATTGAGAPPYAVGLKRCRGIGLCRKCLPASSVVTMTAAGKILRCSGRYPRPLASPCPPHSSMARDRRRRRNATDGRWTKDGRKGPPLARGSNKAHSAACPCPAVFPCPSVRPSLIARLVALPKLRAQCSTNWLVSGKPLSLSSPLTWHSDSFNDSFC